MRSILVCAIIASAALLAGGAQASEPSQGVSLQSAEGQAIARKIAGLSQRLGLPNPLVAPEPEPAAVVRPAMARVVYFRPILTLREFALRHEPLDGRYDTLGGRTGPAAGVKDQLLAERAELLDKLDLDAETRSRIGRN